MTGGMEYCAEKEKKKRSEFLSKIDAEREELIGKRMRQNVVRATELLEELINSITHSPYARNSIIIRNRLVEILKHLTGEQ